jgi:hypothetical protein
MEQKSWEMLRAWLRSLLGIAVGSFELEINLKTTFRMS